MPVSSWYQANTVPTSFLKQAYNLYDMAPTTIFNLHLVPHFKALWITAVSSCLTRKT